MLLVRLFVAFIVLLVLYSIAFQYVMHIEGRDTLHSRIVLDYLHYEFSWDREILLYQRSRNAVHSCCPFLGRLFFVGTAAIYNYSALSIIGARSARITGKHTRPYSTYRISALDRCTRRTVETVQPVYAVLVAEIEEAMLLRDQGIKVVVGALDDPNTFKEMRIDKASYVVATGTDITNTSLVYTIRSISKDIPIIASASGEPAVQILDMPDVRMS